MREGSLGGIEARAAAGPQLVKRQLNLWKDNQKATACGREVFMKTGPAGMHPITVLSPWIEAWVFSNHGEGGTMKTTHPVITGVNVVAESFFQLLER